MISWYVLWSFFHEDSESGLRIADFLRKRVEIAIFRFLDFPEFGWNFRRGRIHVPRPSGALRGGDQRVHWLRRVLNFPGSYSQLKSLEFEPF